VTRIRGNAKHKVLERKSQTNNPAVSSDQIIKYNSRQRGADKLYPIRRIGYRAPKTEQRYILISNHCDWSAQTIADIYKQRWQSASADLCGLFDKTRPDKNLSPQLTLALARRR